MQPTFVITSPAEGLIHINGRLAGETGANTPLILPVTPNGTIYMQFFPFGRRYRPGAYRIKMNAGLPEPDIADSTLYTIVWPGSIAEISVSPMTSVPQESEFSIIDGLPAAVLRGEASLLRIGSSSVALPDGASLPSRHMRINNTEVYMGDIGSGKYIAAFSADELLPIGSVTADNIRISEGGEVTAETSLNDVSGHLRTDTYTLSPTAIERTASRCSPGEGTCFIPKSAEEAALAAVEASLLGLENEVSALLTPPLSAEYLAAVTEDTDLVLPMKYGTIGKYPCVGLVKRAGNRTAAVVPLYYKASHDNGRWTLTAIKKAGEDLP